MTTYTGDARLLAKQKIDDLLRLRGEGTAWAAGLVADGLLPLLSHKTPLSVAEAVEAGLAERGWPDRYADSAVVEAVWGYRAEVSGMSKLLLRGAPWAKPPARDTSTLPTGAEYGPLYVSCIVGSYQHAPVCAPLAVRQHCQSLAAARDTLLALAPNLVAVLLAEALVVATEASHAVHHLVSREPWWPEYSAAVRKTAATVVRPWLWNTLAGYTGPLKIAWQTFLAKPATGGPWRPFLKALNLHVKVKPATLAAAGPLGNLAVALGGQRVLGAGLVETDLERLGVSPGVVKRMLAVPAVLVGRTMKAMRACLAELDPAARARLAMYVHARRGALAETLLYRCRATAVPGATMLYCATCSTARSKFVADRCVSKRLHGLEVDLRAGVVNCSHCPGATTREVVVGELAYRLRYANTTIYTFDACDHCHLLTANPVSKGPSRLCKHCCSRQPAVFYPCFLCKHPTGTRFVATTPHGIRWLCVCDQHRGVIPTTRLPDYHQLLALHGGRS